MSFRHAGETSTLTRTSRIRGDLKRSGVYQGDEEMQRQIATAETTEQFGQRPQETP